MKRFNGVQSAGILALGLLVSACATPPTQEIKESWMMQVVDYETTLGDDHKDSVDNLFKVTPEMRNTVVSKFGKLPPHRAALKMAKWLVDKKTGKGMIYEVGANLTPQQAYEDNRGNCLSFTLLLLQLADELDIKLNVNEVDLPDFWSENEERDLIFYRHVNAIYKTDRHTQVFDLAIEEYGEGYPQRFIGKRHAAALLYSNIGIQKLQKKDLDEALHYLKLAVSMHPRSSDMWINLAAALKRTNHPERAEQAYLRAVALNDRDSIAASNLERLYRYQGRDAQAKKFQKLADRARRRNPYIHYRKAQTAFKNEQYSTARKSIKRAIKLHNEDPKFYALRSMLKQVNKNYIGALKDLEKAHNMSTNTEQRGRYRNKVDRVIARAKQQAEERQRQRQENIDYQNIQLQLPTQF